jgi:tRNA U34 5-carboxymethylaminomethyl modifying GTPase MnmE/TrmE
MNLKWVLENICLVKNANLGKKYKTALIDSPNVGESSVFNMLSEEYSDINNYSGTSVPIDYFHLPIL